MVPHHVILLFLLLIAMPLAAQPADSPGTGGPPSQRSIDGRLLAEQVVNAVGGLEAWNDRYWNIEFDFVVLRAGAEASRVSHIWYRHSNAYLMYGRTKEGKKWEINFTDIMNKTGSATMDGQPVNDSTRRIMLDMGYGRFINDTYWLLMPFKLLDEGVHHRREADTTIDGRPYQVLNLSFGNVGLTPGDRYWLYINPETKLVERWRFLLQSGREGHYLWTDYKEYGPMKISLRKPAVDGSGEIRFDNVQVTNSARRKPGSN